MENNFIKITNVAYGVLEFFPDGEPLKNKAKEKVLAILENATLIFDDNGWLSLKKYLLPEREKTMMQLLDDIEILERYFALAKNQNYISDINFLILTKEYNKIKNSINIRGLIKINEKVSLVTGALNTPSVISHKKPDRIDMQSVINEKKYSERQDPPSDKLLARQRKILDILGQRNRAQVADFIKELPNITKRTVRRDLDDLLKRGKIIRVGEWNQVFYQIGTIGQIT